jgi:hypothetical protein
MAPYCPVADASHTHEVDTFTNTQDHLLSLTASGIPYSHLTQEVEQNVYNVSDPKITKAGPAVTKANSNSNFPKITSI